VIYDIPAHKAGDTWKGIAGITISRNGSAIDLTNATAKMQVRFQIDSPVVLEFSSDDDTIMFVNPTSGILDIPAQIVDVPPATYVYDLKLTLSTGEVKTWLEGKWPITSHVTQN
jgi:hypothetical protein